MLETVRKRRLPIPLLAGVAVLAALLLLSNYVTVEYKSATDVKLRSDAVMEGTSGRDMGVHQCSIYVLDPAKDFGLPACNFSNPAVWPFNTEKPRYEGTPFIKHFQHQLAAEYWVADAIVNRGYAAASMEKADLVYINLHCYTTWFLGYWWQNILRIKNEVHPHTLVEKALETVQALDRYQRSRGRDFVVVQYFPIVFEHLRDLAFGCRSYHPFPLVSERWMFCPRRQRAAEQGRGLILPYVAVHDIDLTEPPSRDKFLVFNAQCNAKRMNDTGWSIGMRFRLELITQLQALNRSDVVAACSHVLGGQGVRHAQMMQLLRRSVFCPVLPGDTQSSKRLSEVVLEGCVPVFLGPPFHTLPLASDIDYAAMAIFLFIKQQPWVTKHEEDRRQFRLWKPDADITRQLAVLESVGDVYAHLKGLPPETVAAKQAALKRERLKFLYSPAPGRNTSVLGDIVVGHLCAYANRRKAAAAREAAQGKQRQEASAGGGTDGEYDEGGEDVGRRAEESRQYDDQGGDDEQEDAQQQEDEGGSESSSGEAVEEAEYEEEKGEHKGDSNAQKRLLLGASAQETAGMAMRSIVTSSLLE